VGQAGDAAESFIEELRDLVSSLKRFNQMEGAVRIRALAEISSRCDTELLLRLAAGDALMLIERRTWTASTATRATPERVDPPAARPKRALGDCPQQRARSA
jgi:hypothetical protein